MAKIPSAVKSRAPSGPGLIDMIRADRGTASTKRSLSLDAPSAFSIH
jgi:hypothetical protein